MLQQLFHGIMAKQVARKLRIHRSTGHQVVSPLVFGEDKIEEQTLPGYRPQIYYPVALGEILAGKYKVIGKLGYGTNSTVWLGEDVQRWMWQARRCSVLKILTNNIAEDSAPTTELKISSCITSVDPRSEGLKYLRTVIDSFELSGPNGKHIGLVYQPMRETLSTFQRRLADQKMPGYFLKPLLRMILSGLDYLHTQCCIIHTDLKPDNILLGFESQAVLEDFIRDEASNPTPGITEGDRLIYPTRNFGDLQGPPGKPKIADFGLAVWGNVPQTHNHPIQADLFQAPEVILRAGWTYSADIWNLGVMIWDLLENRTLFEAIDPLSEQYLPRAHLAEMTSLLGNPPAELLRRGQKAADYFTAEGEPLLCHNETTKTTRFETSVTALTGDDKILFIEFAKKMLRWIPEHRATAAELLRDPWLTSSSANVID